MILRSLAFNVFYVGWTLAFGILLLPSLFLPTILFRRVPRLWAQSMLFVLRRTCGIGGDVRGREHISATPVIYAVKHQSAWDIFILLATLPMPTFVLKRELLWLPVFGLYLIKMRMIAIDRTKGAHALKRMLRQARNNLSRYSGVVIFPEGTRTLPGTRNPYHPGVAALYRHLNIPVVPVALNSGACWPRNAFVKTPGAPTLQFLPPIPPGLPPRELMALLENRIESASAALLRETQA